jgi:hypothetical protein
MEGVEFFNGHFVYSTATWYILWFWVHFVVVWYIFLLLVLCAEKNLATLPRRRGDGSVTFRPSSLRSKLSGAECQ